MSLTESGVLSSGSHSELRGHWRFDNGAGGTAYDTSNNSNDASVPDSMSWEQGKFGKGLNPGGATLATAPHSDSLNITENITISFWARVDNVHGAFMDVVHKVDTAREYFIYFSPAGDSYCFSATYVSDSESFRDTCHSITNVSDGQWHHWAVSQDTSNGILNFYKDGKKLDTTAPSYIDTRNTTTGSLNLGDIDGVLDEVRLYSVVLSDQEIRSLYNMGSIGIGRNQASASGKVLDIGFAKKNSTHVFDTAGKNHGMLIDNPSQRSSVHCKVGRCFEFDGTNDYINISQGDSLNPTDEVTVMGWVKLFDHSTNQMVSMGDAYGDGGSRYGPYNLGFAGSVDAFYWDVWNTTYHREQTASNSGEYNETDTWYHVAGTYDSDDKHRLYINGVLENEDTDPIGTMPTTWRPLQIGQEQTVPGADGSNHCNCLLDQIKVYNRELSQKEIADEANLPTDGALAHYRFDTGGGDLLYDHSIHDNHGTFSPDEATGPTWTTGHEGSGLSFDGSNDEVVIGDVVENEDRLTVSAWVKPQTRDDWFVGEGQSFRVGFTSTDEVRCWHRGDNSGGTDTSDTTTTSTSPISSADRWYHITCTWDGPAGDRKIYVNGQLEEDDSTNVVEFNGDSNNFVIGNGYEGAGSYFDGKVDDLYVYPYVVDRDQRNSLHTRGTSRISGKAADESTGSTPENALGDTDLEVFHGLDRIETCGQSDTISCPSGMDGKVAVDTSGLGNHGELISDAHAVSATECQTGGCVRFDGVNDYIEIADDPSIEFTHNFTISVWFKSDVRIDETTNNETGLVSKNGSYGIWWQEETGGELRFGTFGGRTISNRQTWKADTWYHVVATHEDNTDTQRIYVNGVLDSEGTNTDQVTKVNTALRIGSDEFERTYFDGVIDEVRLYNRSLQPNEAGKLYDRGRPLGHWTFNEGFGDRLHDRSITKNHASWNSAGPAEEKRYIVNQLHESETLEVASYEDGNKITAGSCTKTVDEGEVKTFSASCYSVGDTVTSDYPFSAQFTRDGADGPVPASFAGQEFVYRDCRDPEYFNILALDSSANIDIKNATETVYSTSLGANSHTEINTDMPTGTVYTIESDSDILVTYDRGNNDQFMMHPASTNVWGYMEDAYISKDNTQLTAYDSDGNTVASGVYHKFDQISLGGNNQGASETHHVVANQSALGGDRCADGDNGESDIGVPSNRMADEFRLPLPVSGLGGETGDYYISITSTEATTCTIYDSDGSKAAEKSTTNSHPEPGVMTFDTWDDMNVSAGAQISCTSPVAIQWEPSGSNEGESNLYGFENRPAGTTGNGLRFDSGDDYVTLDSPVTLSKDGATLLWWMDPADTGDTALFTNQQGGFSSLIESRTGAIKAETDTNCNRFDFEGVSKDTAAAHYAIVFNNSKAYLYKDGDFVKESGDYGSDGCSGGSTNQMVDDTTLQYFGTSTAYSPGYNGTLDDVRVYPYALTGKQIEAVKDQTGMSVG